MRAINKVFGQMGAHPTPDFAHQIPQRVTLFDHATKATTA